MQGGQGSAIAIAFQFRYNSTMNAILPIEMTVDEFLRWSVRQEKGRYELDNGRVIAMPSESIGSIG